jgi:predicted  nucleic acid-binding Zn-ribbon protein
MTVTDSDKINSLNVDVAVIKSDVNYIKTKLDEISKAINNNNDKMDKTIDRVTNLEKYQVSLESISEANDKKFEKDYKSARVWFLGFTTVFTALNLLMMYLLRVR